MSARTIWFINRHNVICYGIYSLAIKRHINIIKLMKALLHRPPFCEKYALWVRNDIREIANEYQSYKCK